MKKCLMMFALLLVTIIVAVLTERRQEIATIDNLALGENISEEIAFEQSVLDQNASTNNE